MRIGAEYAGERVMELAVGKREKEDSKEEEEGQKVD